MTRRKDEEAGIGHNQTKEDQARIEVTEYVLKQKAIIQEANDKIKEKLNWAKDTHGILKGGVRKAVKALLKTEEQHASDQEVAAETQRIIELFVEKDGQFSFLSDAA